MKDSKAPEDRGRRPVRGAPMSYCSNVLKSRCGWADSNTEDEDDKSEIRWISR